MKFCIENLGDKDICFYTGYTNRGVFNAVLEYLNPGSQGENIVLNDGNSSTSEEIQCNVKSGRPRKLSPCS